MSNITDDEAYNYGLELFYAYILKKVNKDFFEELNKVFLNNSTETFFTYYLKSLGFENMKDAKEFAKYIQSYYAKEQQLPEYIPDRDVLLSVLQQ